MYSLAGYCVLVAYVVMKWFTKAKLADTLTDRPALPLSLKRLKNPLEALVSLAVTKPFTIFTRVLCAFFVRTLSVIKRKQLLLN